MSQVPLCGSILSSPKPEISGSPQMHERLLFAPVPQGANAPLPHLPPSAGNEWQMVFTCLPANRSTCDASAGSAKMHCCALAPLLLPHGAKMLPLGHGEYLGDGGPGLLVSVRRLRLVKLTAGATLARVSLRHDTVAGSNDGSRHVPVVPVVPASASCARVHAGKDAPGVHSPPPS